MLDSTAKEVLIRIDERVKNLKDDISLIKDTLEKQDCRGKEQRIQGLEKSMARRIKFEVAFWPSILTAIGTVIGAVIFIGERLMGG